MRETTRRTRRDPGRGERRPRRRTGRLVAAPAALTTWLGRPLTSLHLVLGVFGLLTTLGLVMVLSASNVESYAQDGSSYTVFGKQVVFCGIGLVLFWVALRVPPPRLRAVSPVLVAGAVVALAVVLVPGVGADINGSRAWFVVAGLSFQPSEPAKVALALWGAHVLCLRRHVLHRWRHALVPLVPVAVVIFLLVVLEPDLGNTISLGIVLVALLWFAAAPLGLLGTLSVGGVVGTVVLGFTASYRENRITAFLHPETADPLGTAYQARQALYSLADGGLWGVGLGQGRAKWSYLPNAHNDFIFAIIGEELGFIGAFAVLALFATLAYTGLRIAARNTDPWIKITAATLTLWLVAQAGINVGYVVGLLPVTGITLPLVSSGGTSLVTTTFGFGLLANFARHEPEAVVALTQPSPGQRPGPPGRGRRASRSGPHAAHQGWITRLLRLPAPSPYRPPAVRPATLCSQPGGVEERGEVPVRRPRRPAPAPAARGVRR